MPLLGKFIESLHVRVTKAAFREVLNPFIYDAKVDDTNIIVLLNKGNMFGGYDDFKIKPETSYFIPQAQHAHIKLGRLKDKFQMPVSGFSSEDHRKKYLKELSGLKSWDDTKSVITVINFEVLLYNAIPFFPLLGISSLPIPYDQEFFYLVQHLALEEEQRKLGRDIMMNNYIQEIMIHLFRYLETLPQFQSALKNLDYLTDKRLATIVNYIQQNLQKDLSNKSIAKVAFVSEDYVGQLFKSLTKNNLQEYIENQRLERAMTLIRTSTDSVLEISVQVGFKDSAYFSRRFKNKFGVNATDVRKKKDAMTWG
jgi:AraC family transcriptional regulator, arabinose operon regulatory protein